MLHRAPTAYRRSGAWPGSPTASPGCRDRGRSWRQGPIPPASARPADPVPPPQPSCRRHRSPETRARAWRGAAEPPAAQARARARPARPTTEPIAPGAWRRPREPRTHPRYRAPDSAAGTARDPAYRRRRASARRDPAAAVVAAAASRMPFRRQPRARPGTVGRGCRGSTAWSPTQDRSCCRARWRSRPTSGRRTGAQARRPRRRTAPAPCSRRWRRERPLAWPLRRARRCRSRSCARRRDRRSARPHRSRRAPPGSPASGMAPTR